MYTHSTTIIAKIYTSDSTIYSLRSKYTTPYSTMYSLRSQQQVCMPYMILCGAFDPPTHYSIYSSIHLSGSQNRLFWLTYCGHGNLQVQPAKWVIIDSFDLVEIPARVPIMTVHRAVFVPYSWFLPLERHLKTNLLSPYGQNDNNRTHVYKKQFFSGRATPTSP